MNVLAERPTSRVADALAVAAAALVSIVLVQFVTGSLVVALAFAGGLVVLGLIAFAAARGNRAARAADAPAIPDWSVTVTAIAQPGVAVAITDRANRLVCANAAFELWFGSSHAPPRLPVDGTSAEALARAARNAWREGEGGRKRSPTRPTPGPPRSFARGAPRITWCGVSSRSCGTSRCRRSASTSRACSGAC